MMLQQKSCLKCITKNTINTYIKLNQMVTSLKAQKVIKKIHYEHLQCMRLTRLCKQKYIKKFSRGSQKLKWKLTGHLIYIQMY